MKYRIVFNIIMLFIISTIYVGYYCYNDAKRITSEYENIGNKICPVCNKATLPSFFSSMNMPSKPDSSVLVPPFIWFCSPYCKESTYRIWKQYDEVMKSDIAHIQYEKYNRYDTMIWNNHYINSALAIMIPVSCLSMLFWSMWFSDRKYH